jgi:hypothetical protein
MKAFHYNQEIVGAASARQTQTSFMHGGTNPTMITTVGAGEDKLDMLKKQIEHLKRCV